MVWRFQGCRPYSIAECEHYVNGTRPPCRQLPTPICVQQCDSEYKVAYDDDKHFGEFITLFYIMEIIILFFSFFSSAGLIILRVSIKNVPLLFFE